MVTSSAETPRLQTVRLTLTPLRVEDAEEMARLLDDARLHEFTGGAPLDVDALRERYRRQVRGRSPDGGERWLNWIVRMNGDATAIGTVQASIRDGSDGVAEIAWIIGVAWQRRGLATEAARAVVAWLAAQAVVAIEAHIAVGHVASQIVAARLGLARTQRLVEGEDVWSNAPPDYA